MGEQTVADSSAPNPPAPAPAPTPGPPRRPRVREVSSRFMSPQVSSSAESPHHHNNHHNPLTARSPIHRHNNLGSTPIPNTSDHRPRSSSANRRRRQLDMEQTLGDSDPNPNPTPPSSPRAPIASSEANDENAPPTNLRKQRLPRSMKENIGSRHTPIPVHPPSKKSQARPDTPVSMLSASLDRSISVPSRFRATPQRLPNKSDSDSMMSVQDCRENAAQMNSSTQSLPELLKSGGGGNGNSRASTDSLKITPFSSARYLNLPEGSERLPGRDPCLPLPARKPVAKKAGPSHQEDYNSLKLLQNRYLQWRYANARAEASLRALERETQTKVNSLRVKMSEMYESVAKKRTELGILQRTQTLSAILDAQVPYLDQWSELDGEYSISLAETTQALVNASVQLPLGGNIKVDVKELQECLNSAMKVMDSMASNAQHLFPKAAETENLMSELAKTVGGERGLVEDCGALLSKTHRLQVDEWSLRGQIIQLNALKL